MESSELAITLPGNWASYLAAAFVASLIVRGVISFLRGLEAGRSDFLAKIWISFKGYGSDNSETDDHWQNFILGWLEFAVYPVLFASGFPEYVGAWLALKTLPQWEYWKKSRKVYNRFLIANLLVIVISYVWLQGLITH